MTEASVSRLSSPTTSVSTSGCLCSRCSLLEGASTRRLSTARCMRVGGLTVPKISCQRSATTLPLTSGQPCRTCRSVGVVQVGTRQGLLWEGDGARPESSLPLFFIAVLWTRCRIFPMISVNCIDTFNITKENLRLHFLSRPSKYYSSW